MEMHFTEFDKELISILAGVGIFKVSDDKTVFESRSQACFSSITKSIP